LQGRNLQREVLNEGLPFGKTILEVPKAIQTPVLGARSWLSHSSRSNKYSSPQDSRLDVILGCEGSRKINVGE
jgi:hypothetical protein